MSWTNEQIEALEKEVDALGPDPWRLICGRPKGMYPMPNGREIPQMARWDIYSGPEALTLRDLQNGLAKKNGSVQRFHFHPESPSIFELNPNWEKDAHFVVKAKEIAKALIETHRELQKLKGEHNGQ